MYLCTDYHLCEDRTDSAPDVTKTMMYMYSGGAPKQYLLPYADSHHYDVPQLTSQDYSYWMGNIISLSQCHIY